MPLRTGARPVDTTQQHKAFLLLLALVSVAFFWLLIPFYGAVFWAGVLAIVFQPLQRSFERRFGPRSNLAALTSLLVCIVIAIIPMALLLGALVGEGTHLVQQVQQGTFDTTTIFADLHTRCRPGCSICSTGSGWGTSTPCAPG